MKPIVLFFAALLYVNIAQAQVPGGVSLNIAAWLKADAGTLNGTNPAADGQAVNTWQDQSMARTNDATDATLVAPIFRNNPGYFMNYNPVVDFDGTSHGLDYGNDYVFSSGTGTEDGITWFAVVEPDLTPTTKTYPYLVDFGAFHAFGFGFRYGSNLCAMYTSTDPLHGGSAPFSAHSFGTKPKLVRFTVDFGTNQTLNLDGAQSPIIFTTFTPGDVPALGADQIDESPTHQGLSGPLTIGHQSKSGLINSNGGRRFDGSIAEIIGYSADLSDAAGGDINKIESYLAIKYAITLDNAGAGTNGDYTSTNGITIWDASDDPPYHNDVIGIGQDDNTDLLQKQSHQLDDSTRIYLSTLNASNAGNTGSFNTDRQYLIMGHDTEPLESQGSTEYPPGLGIYSRIEREWRITNTSFDGTFSLDITLNTSPLFVSDLRLLVDLDGDFTDATMYNPTMTVNGTTVTISGLSTTHVPINTTRYLTIVSLSSTTPLPIELISFEAEAVEQTVELSWITASETDNDYFTIERSLDLFLWNDLDQVDGSGNTTEEVTYSTRDYLPYPGTSYYRLKQTDFNGNSSHLGIRAVHFDAPYSFIVYPNPTHSQINIEGNGLNFNDVQIFDALGKNVSVRVQSLSNTNSKLVLDLSNLSSGLYTVRIRNGMLKFFKE